LAIDEAAELEAQVGHPLDRWEALKERVQSDAIHRFAEVQDEWLALMWCLDSYRTAGVRPRGVTGKLGTFVRRKGNWFAELMALLLQNRTSQPVGARTRVEGFSQPHQIDVAWPARREDVLVCAETKVTGGPPFADTPARGSIADWPNRRKELKFAATDLKLFRRAQETSINHWDVWRRDAPPRTFFLWGARLKEPEDTAEKLASELQAIINTYLDGAGVFAWRPVGQGYSAVQLPALARGFELDDVLYRIASEIQAISAAAGGAPEPVLPERPAVDTERLEPDQEE
jgi:hypothetical protein